MSKVAHERVFDRIVDDRSINPWPAIGQPQTNRLKKVVDEFTRSRLIAAKEAVMRKRNKTRIDGALRLQGLPPEREVQDADPGVRADTLRG